MKKLLDITKLGDMTLKNRFIRSAVADHVIDGHLNDEIYKLYEDLAKGGVGTIITGCALIDKVEKALPLLAMYDDSFINEYKTLTDKVHKHNANIILQLAYVGSVAMEDTLGPSAVPHLNSQVVPKEMTIDEIKNIEQSFATAALRAKNTGFDGVEIHAAHGLLLSQFLTPYYNQRTDIYGGEIKNRARIIFETYSAIRNAVGPEFSIFIKINSSDGFENGLEFEDCKYVCKELTKLGINFIDISGDFIPQSKKKDIYFKEEAAQIAKENDVAVIVTGGGRNFEQMENLLNETNISYLGLGRPFISEPDLINKWASGDTSKPKCVSCNKCFETDGSRCILNQKR